MRNGVKSAVPRRLDKLSIEEYGARRVRSTFDNITAEDFFMVEHNWFYPEAPVGNVFASHPDYDEARGPNHPYGHHVPIDELSEDDAVGFDKSDESAADDQSLPFSIPAAIQPYAETAWDWWTAIKTTPVVETKISLKEFDRRSRRWRRVSTPLSITA